MKVKVEKTRGKINVDGTLKEDRDYYQKSIDEEIKAKFLEGKSSLLSIGDMDEKLFETIRDSLMLMGPETITSNEKIAQKMGSS